MKFKQLINERYVKTIDVYGDAIEIFVSPSRKEILDIFKQNNGVRMGFIDKPLPVMYIWTGFAFHVDVHKQLKFDFGMYIDDKTSDIVFSDGPVGWKNWSEIKNKKAIMRKIKSMFPKVKYYQFVPHKSVKKEIEI